MAQWIRAPTAKVHILKLTGTCMLERQKPTSTRLSLSFLFPL